MDRNLLFRPGAGSPITVALRKESVDRNALSLLTYHLKFGSLSARRAWIEIDEVLTNEEQTEVALRKESVDRNNAMQIVIVVMNAVALRKESVDRNEYTEPTDQAQSRRSPQGERG